MRRFTPVLLLTAALLAGCRSSRQACETPKAKPAATALPQERYAVLINGDSERRHKENVSRAYATLRALGFDASRIIVVSPADRRSALAKGTLRVAPSPDKLWRVMDDLTETVKESDLLLVYGTGHGDTDQGGSLLELRRGELWSDDLRDEVDQYRGRTVIIMDQCYSGGFVDAFTGTKSRVIVISSVDSHNLTDCTEFAETFWDSFLHPEKADRNGDRKTSVREAFDAALEAHKKALAGDRELSANGTYRAFNGFDDVLLN